MEDTQVIPINKTLLVWDDDDEAKAVEKYVLAYIEGEEYPYIGGEPRGVGWWGWRNAKNLDGTPFKPTRPKIREIRREMLVWDDNEACATKRHILVHVEGEKYPYISRAEGCGGGRDGWKHAKEIPPTKQSFQTAVIFYKAGGGLLAEEHLLRVIGENADEQFKELLDEIVEESLPEGAEVLSVNLLKDIKEQCTDEALSNNNVLLKTIEF